VKYAARVTQVLHSINKIGGLVDGEVRAIADMPLPNRVEIVPDGSDGSFVMYRYTSAGEVCGDTWHQTLKDAFDQATYEYGLREADFLQIH
jgi:hypothetical protein